MQYYQWNIYVDVSWIKIAIPDFNIPAMDSSSTNLPSAAEQDFNRNSNSTNPNIDQRGISGIIENGLTVKAQKEVKVRSIWHRFVSMVRVRVVFM